MSNLSDFINTGSGGGGLSEIEIKRESMILDELLTGAVAGTAFDIYDCVDFSPSSDGAIWFNFLFPDGFDYTRDIEFVLSYSFNGNDPGNDVYLEAEMWINEEGDVPTEVSPTFAANESITSVNTGNPNPNIGCVGTKLLSTIKIDESLLDSNTNKIGIKLSRLSSHANDDYTGTMQLMSIQIKQPEEE